MGATPDESCGPRKRAFRKGQLSFPSYDFSSTITVYGIYLHCGQCASTCPGTVTQSRVKTFGDLCARLERNWRVQALRRAVPRLSQESCPPCIPKRRVRLHILDEPPTRTKASGSSGDTPEVV
jgi:hypothetical protein